MLAAAHEAQQGAGMASPPFAAPALAAGDVVRLQQLGAPGALRFGDVARVVCASPDGGVRVQRLDVYRALSWWYRPAALRRPHPAAAAALAELDLVCLAPGFAEVTDAARAPCAHADARRAR